jgi:hypothetical protein
MLGYVWPATFEATGINTQLIESIPSWLGFAAGQLVPLKANAYLQHILVTVMSSRRRRLTYFTMQKYNGTLPHKLTSLITKH